MLMTPMTPKVIASPVAASTSTEPRLSPKKSVSTPEYMLRVESILCTAAVAAARTAGSLSLKLPSGPGSIRAASRLRTSVLNRSDNVATACRRPLASSPSRAASASAVSISRATAASVSLPARARSSSTVLSSSVRIMSFTAASRTLGSGLASANRATVVRRNRRRRLFVPTFVSVSGEAEPTPRSETGSRSSKVVRLSSIDLAMTTVWSSLTNRRSSSIAVSRAPALE